MFPSPEAPIYSMSPILAFLARTFPGIRISISRLEKIKTASWCKYDDVLFPFVSRFMDRKRFVAMAAGAIEYDEVAIAKQVISKDDILVEFGAGLGIAAARVHKLCSPKGHICFEANPLLGEYTRQLFKVNKLNIHFENIALGNGQTLPFHAMDDYILSTFPQPAEGQAFTRIEVTTITLDAVIKAHQPTVIFCDIEGAELDYFTSDQFEGVKKIVIELHPEIYGKHGLSAFCTRMQKQGFALKQKQRQTYCFVRQ